jgi:hypothetical protein
MTFPRSIMAKALAIALVAAAANSAHAIALLDGGYQQTFDSMGTADTALPTDWTLWNGASNSNNNTWTNATGITVSDVTAMVQSTTALTAITTPSGNNNSGWNAARSAALTADRVVATAPTTNAGTGLQLLLTNSTSSSFNQFLVSYDTVRYTAASTAGDLPGYQMFAQVNSGVWTNIAALNPPLTQVPNTAGLTSVSGALVTLGSAVNVGDTLRLRWIDDNATQSSPDQILGLNNVLITAIPEPHEYALMLAGLGLVGTVTRRRAQRRLSV